MQFIHDLTARNDKSVSAEAPVKFQCQRAIGIIETLTWLGWLLSASKVLIYVFSPKSVKFLWEYGIWYCFKNGFVKIHFTIFQLVNTSTRIQALTSLTYLQWYEWVPLHLHLLFKHLLSEFFLRKINLHCRISHSFNIHQTVFVIRAVPAFSRKNLAYSTSIMCNFFK